MIDPRTFVIVGAGQAGRWLALTLRADGFSGRIVWFGEEPHGPYERPPLSKAVLKGEVALEQLALIQAEKLAQLDCDFRAGQRIVGIDCAARDVTSSTGERTRYDTLFLAHGGAARMLPGVPAHPRVISLRTWDDALALKSRLGQAQRVLVLGGGWIGLEVAASARTLGRDVALLEAAPRLCIRTVPECISAWLLELHQGRGIDVRLGDGVSGVVPDDSGVSVTLASGAQVRGDVLIVGIGLVPHDTLARAAGIECANGVLTDAHGRSSDPHVYAVGDVANAQRADGQRVRIESWENAQRQAVAAAKAALGIAHDPEAEGPPWFWSDQYDENLQLLGTPAPSMQLIERHQPAKRQRLYFFCEGGQVLALAAINAGRELKITRKWMLQGRFPELGALADTSLELNKLPLT